GHRWKGKGRSRRAAARISRSQAGRTAARRHPAQRRQRRGAVRAQMVEWQRELTAMTVEQLREMMGARPFRPFRVHLADGRSVDVEHPEFLMSSRTGRTIVVSKPNDTFEIIDLLLVANLE